MIEGGGLQCTLSRPHYRTRDLEMRLCTDRQVVVSKGLSLSPTALTTCSDTFVGNLSIVKCICALQRCPLPLATANICSDVLLAAVGRIRHLLQVATQCHNLSLGVIQAVPSKHQETAPLQQKEQPAFTGFVTSATKKRETNALRPKVCY